MIKSTLKKLGLTPKEIQVYLVLVQLGPTLASTLTRHTKLPRTTIYTLLETLKKKGFISRVIKNKTTYFTALSPHLLKKKAENNVETAKQIQKEVEEIIPELSGLIHAFSSQPKVFFYEGAEGVKNLYEDTLQAEKEMKIFVTVEKLPQELKQYLCKDYIKKRLKKQIFTKAILSNSKGANKYKQLDQKSLRKSVILPKHIQPFESEICLYNKNQIAIISFKSEIVGIKIQNDALFNTLHSVFDALWSSYTH